MPALLFFLRVLSYAPQVFPLPLGGGVCLLLSVLAQGFFGKRRFGGIVSLLFALLGCAFLLLFSEKTSVSLFAVLVTALLHWFLSLKQEKPVLGDGEEVSR